MKFQTEVLVLVNSATAHSNGGEPTPSPPFSSPRSSLSTRLACFGKTFLYLLGRSPGPKYLAKIERLARSVPGVLGIHDLRAEYLSPALIRAGMHIEVQPGISIEEADRIAETVQELIYRETEADAIVIHVDPAKIPPLEGS